MQQSAQMGEIETGARPPRTEPAAAFVTFIVVSGVRLLAERPLRSCLLYTSDAADDYLEV